MINFITVFDIDRKIEGVDFLSWGIFKMVCMNKQAEKMKDIPTSQHLIITAEQILSPTYVFEGAKYYKII